MTAQNPAILAAAAVAAAANAGGPSDMPAATVALSPRVCETNDGELAATLYAIPTACRTERETRAGLRRNVTVALVALFPARTDADAADALALVQNAADAVLAEGARDGVKFLSAAASELYDQQLLADQGILRAQIDIDCLLFGEVER